MDEGMTLLQMAEAYVALLRRDLDVDPENDELHHRWYEAQMDLQYFDRMLTGRKYRGEHDLGDPSQPFRDLKEKAQELLDIARKMEIKNEQRVEVIGKIERVDY